MMETIKILLKLTSVSEDWKSFDFRQNVIAKMYLLRNLLSKDVGCVLNILNPTYTVREPCGYLEILLQNPPAKWKIISSKNPMTKYV